MQRDMKIGMALGLALVGIVGALFFRREPEVKKDAPPALQSAEELDRQIAEKARPPYIKGLEDFADPAASAPQAAGAGKPKPKTDAYDVPGFLNKGDQTENQELLARKMAAAPDPIQAPPAKDEPVAASGPAHNREWEAAGTGAPPKPGAAPRAAGAPATGRTHVIRAGETLSGLAARYLGSSSRYREIYEANRNVLRSADDLPDGVKIVIPDGKPRDPQRGSGTSTANQNGVKVRNLLARPHEESESRTTSEATSEGDAPREKIRFVPVHRGPFSAGRVTPSKSDPDSRRKPAASSGSAEDDEP